MHTRGLTPAALCSPLRYLLSRHYVIITLSAGAERGDTSFFPSFIVQVLFYFHILIKVILQSPGTFIPSFLHFADEINKKCTCAG